MNRVTVGRENEVDRDAARPHAAALPQCTCRRVSRACARSRLSLRDKWHVARF